MLTRGMVIRTIFQLAEEGFLEGASSEQRTLYYQLWVSQLETLEGVYPIGYTRMTASCNYSTVFVRRTFEINNLLWVQILQGTLVFIFRQ
jgi:hypothetical protein